MNRSLKGRDVANRIRTGLRAAADPDRAAGMRAYLKSDLPCLGVSIPRMRNVCREVLSGIVWSEADEWIAAVLSLWREADFREERHAAVEVSGWKRCREWQTPAVLPVYEEMVVSGAWWDLVDPIAADRVGGLLRTYPETLAPIMRRWAVDRDPWKRRTAILSQLRFKSATDRKLLADVILPSLDETFFFLRKGIGWALREFSKTDPGWVEAFVSKHETRLSSLSRREALRLILKKERGSQGAPCPEN